MRLAVEKDVKLPGLKTVKGFDLVIPCAKDVPGYTHGGGSSASLGAA